MMGDPAGARARLEKAGHWRAQGMRRPLDRRTRTSWRCGKNADSDVPILVQAKADYAKLQ
jgi:hypothetical protein